MLPKIPASADLKTDQDELKRFLVLLLEPSDILHGKLVPNVHTKLQDFNLVDYAQVLDICENEVDSWTIEDKEGLISGHPLIGEVHGLSGFSSKEQGNLQPTPEAVLRRLAHLNKVYTAIYPSLPYITYVAGRPRSAIVTEIEDRLGIDHAQVPLSMENGDIDQPALSSDVVRDRVKAPHSPEWEDELDRAVKDVWKIARARLHGLVNA